MKFTTAALFAAGAAAQSLTDALKASSDLSALRGLLSTQPDLTTALGSAKNITILAPNDAAVAKLTGDAATVAAIGADPGLTAAILSYHVINGTAKAAAFTSSAQFLPTLLDNSTYEQVTGGQRVQGSVVDGNVVIKSGYELTSNVTKADITFDGGVIHIIDSVLTLPPNASAALSKFSLGALAGALTKADLVKTVEGLKDVTIFAPADSAFAKIAATAGNLTTEQLSSVLTYHVVQGTVAYSSSLKDSQKVKTVNGQELTISVKDGKVTVGNATVVKADVLISNGVVHVIDSVLIPGTDSTNGTGSGGTTPAPPPSAGNRYLVSGLAAFAAGVAMVLSF